jgi:hypothetical protein
MVTKIECKYNGSLAVDKRTCSLETGNVHTTFAGQHLAELSIPYFQEKLKGSALLSA